MSDIKEMNTDQKRRIKIVILNLTGNILNKHTYKTNSVPFTKSTSLTSSSTSQDSSYELPSINQKNPTEATMYYINDQQSTSFEPSSNEQTSIIHLSNSCTQDGLIEFLKYPRK